MVMCLRSCRCKQCRGKSLRLNRRIRRRDEEGKEEWGISLINCRMKFWFRFCLLGSTTGSDHKELAFTSVVSKRWMHLWKFTNRLLLFNLPPLDYNVPMELAYQDAAKFVRSVNRVLQTLMLPPAAATNPLEEFRICFELYRAQGIELFNELSSSLDDWLYYALAVEGG